MSLGSMIRTWREIRDMHQSLDAERHKMALDGKLGEAAKANAERLQWCAKVAQQTVYTAEQIEQLLVLEFQGNKEALCRSLGVKA